MSFQCPTGLMKQDRPISYKLFSIQAKVLCSDEQDIILPADKILQPPVPLKPERQRAIKESSKLKEIERAITFKLRPNAVKKVKGRPRKLLKSG